MDELREERGEWRGEGAHGDKEGSAQVTGRERQQQQQQHWPVCTIMNELGPCSGSLVCDPSYVAPTGLSGRRDVLWCAGAVLILMIDSFQWVLFLPWCCCVPAGCATTSCPSPVVRATTSTCSAAARHCPPLTLWTRKRTSSLQVGLLCVCCT